MESVTSARPQGCAAFVCIVLLMRVCEIAGGKCQCHSIMYQGKTQEMNSSLRKVCVCVCVCVCVHTLVSACTLVFEYTEQNAFRGKGFVFASVSRLSVIIVSVRGGTQIMYKRLQPARACDSF